MYQAKRTKNKIFKSQHKLPLLLLAIALVLAIAMPAMAQRDILTTTQNNINNTEIWWDQLWESTFNPTPVVVNGGVASAAGLENTTNLSLYAFVNPTRLLLGIGLIFWLFSFGYKMVESKTVAQSTHSLLKLFVPVFIALLFLANQATYSRVLAYGMRDLVNSWSEGVMNLQVTDFSVREALQDRLVTEDAKEEVARKFAACNAMDKPEVIIPSLVRPDTSDPDIPPITPAQRKVYDYLECLDELSAYAQEKLDAADAERQCSGSVCRIYKSFLNIFLNVSANAYDYEAAKRLYGETPTDQASIDKLAEIRQRLDSSLEKRDEFLNPEAVDQFVASLSSPSKPFLYFTQWMWVSTLELAMFLLALFAPMFIALSVIPGRQNMFNFWLIEYLTIGLAKMAYTIVIGIVAVQLASSDSGFIDNTFFMSLGIFAPAVSFAVVASGGLAAASSFRSQSTGAVALAAGTLSTGAATIAYSMSRAYDKRR